MTSTPATGPTSRFGQSGAVAVPPGRMCEALLTCSATARFSVRSTLIAPVPSGLERDAADVRVVGRLDRDAVRGGGLGQPVPDIDVPTARWLRHTGQPLGEDDRAGLGRGIGAVLGHALLGEHVPAVHDRRDHGDRDEDRADHDDDGLAGLALPTGAPAPHGNTLSTGISDVWVIVIGPMNRLTMGVEMSYSYVTVTVARQPMWRVGEQDSVVLGGVT